MEVKIVETNKKIGFVTICKEKIKLPREIDMTVTRELFDHGSHFTVHSSDINVTSSESTLDLAMMKFYSKTVDFFSI